MDIQHEPSLSDYDWLFDAIKPYCDKVLKHVGDCGALIGIGCQWGSGPTQRRIAIVAERAASPLAVTPHRPRYSLNAEIAEGRTTRNEVVEILIKPPISK